MNVVDLRSEYTKEDILDYYYRSLTLGVEFNLADIHPGVEVIIESDESVDDIVLVASDKLWSYTSFELLLPDYITSLDAYTFYHNSGLKALTCGKSLRNIYNSCLYASNIERLTIQETGLAIGPDACYSCNKLVEVKGSENILKLYNNAFSLCTNLKELDLSNCELIAYSAFDKSGIEKLVLSDNLRCDALAFDNMPDLKKVIIKKRDGTGNIAKSLFHSGVEFEYI